MKIIIYISLILLILTSCQKDKFTSCASYDALVGEWISVEVDNGTKDRIKLSGNGLYEYISAFGRGTKKKMSLCIESGPSGYGPNWRYIDLISDKKNIIGESGASIAFTNVFDTILVGGASFFDDEGKLKIKRFVRN